MKIHPTAVIDMGAEFGDGVTVGPGAVIDSDVRIDDGCVIGPHAVIHKYTTLGPRCRVHAHAVLGDLPQDLAFKDEPSYVRIGADCIIREHVTIHRGTKSGSATEVGDGCFLMAGSHLGHNVVLGRKVIVVNNALLAGYVQVGDGAFLSTCSVHQFVRIGRMAMIAGKAGLTKDVPPFCTTNHGMSTVVGLNVVGLKRAGFTPSERQEIKRAFRLLYCSGLNVKQALPKLKEAFHEGPAGEFAAFIESSKRGICAFGAAADDDGE
jgi:UDP-N-acetylglucosamine acyltransferase